MTNKYDTPKVNLEINGKFIQALQGTMLIEVTDQQNLSVPRFCYHKKLSIAANCRMCLVDVEKVIKPLPACATPVTEGMKVWTNSKKARDAQKAVMEFLLINHPLDCPICDQGGECELQDIAMGYGQGISRFQEEKRVVIDEDLGPLIATDMTRCILCTRCVRFGTEVAGLRELGTIGRGEFTRISTFVEQAISSNISSNIIDLCPVGALTSKPFRFRARPWELQKKSSISAHDCWGSNINLHICHDQVMRVVPKENEQINELWLSDRDRFAYEGLRSDERLKTPIQKIDGQWKAIDWPEAINLVIKFMHQIPGNMWGFLGSTQSTLEELYLFQKIARQLGCANIDHRLKQQDFQDQDYWPIFPDLGGLRINEIEQLGAVLIVGSNVQQACPLAAIRLQKMIKNGGMIASMNPSDFNFCFKVHQHINVCQGEFIKTIKSLLNNCCKRNRPTITDSNSLEYSYEKIVTMLFEQKKSSILIGDFVLQHPQASIIIGLLNKLAITIKAKVGVLTQGPNTSGAWLTGVLPHRQAGGVKAKNTGLHAQQMLTQSLKAYCLMGFEPDVDTLYGQQAMYSIKNADFVVALHAYRSKSLEDVADLILPMVPFSETDGTYVNVSGQWQRFSAAMHPFMQSKPAWKILRVIGSKLNKIAFTYQKINEVFDEIRQIIPTMIDNKWHAYAVKMPIEVSHLPQQLIWLAETSLYHSDAIVRRAKSLQKTITAQNEKFVYLHPKTAKRFAVTKNGDQIKVHTDYGWVHADVLLNDKLDQSSLLGCQGNKLERYLIYGQKIIVEGLV